MWPTLEVYLRTQKLRVGLIEVVKFDRYELRGKIRTQPVDSKTSWVQSNMGTNNDLILMSTLY